eukprot:m.141872 g.141872  ORF g.141872 m.141872 type:complete len:459 (-) comp30218_c0_seq2:53-1429(-)
MDNHPKLISDHTANQETCIIVSQPNSNPSYGGVEAVGGRPSVPLEVYIASEAENDEAVGKAVLAAEKGDIWGLYTMACEGIDLSTQYGPKGMCPMEAAILSKQWDVVRFLWYLGASVRKSFKVTGLFPIHHAIQQGDFKQSLWLCNVGVSLRFRPKLPKTTPQSCAASLFRIVNEQHLGGKSAYDLAVETFGRQLTRKLRSQTATYGLLQATPMGPLLSWFTMGWVVLFLDAVMSLGLAKRIDQRWFGVEFGNVPQAPDWIVANNVWWLLLSVMLLTLAKCNFVWVLMGVERVLPTPHAEYEYDYDHAEYECDYDHDPDDDPDGDRHSSMQAIKKVGMINKVFCPGCKLWRPRRARHCHFSGVCIEEYASYCHVARRPIGKGNYLCFVAWLLCEGLLFTMIAVVSYYMHLYLRAVISFVAALAFFQALFPHVRAQRHGKTLNEYLNSTLPDQVYSNRS